MNIVTWVVQILLSFALLIPAIMKLTKPYEEFITKATWGEDFSPTQLIIIGILEALAIIGLNLPFLLKRFKKLVPISAAGLILLFGGAIKTHIGRDEPFMVPLVLMAMALFVTYSRKDLLKA